MKNWVIYKIVSPSGKVYIGLTSNYCKRMCHYKNHKSLKQPYLFASFKKYGFENHHTSIIDQFESELDYAHGKEMFWVRSYMSNIIKWKDGDGLNLTHGGQGTVGYKATDEQRKRLSEAHKGLPSGQKGKKMSEETKQKLREYNRLHPPRGMKGKKMSQETKDKIKETKSKRYYPPKPPRPTKEETRLKQSLAKIGKPPPNKGKKGLQVAWNKGLKIGTSWNKGVSYSHLSAEERKIKFGKHNIGNSYNKGRKQKPEVIAARVARQVGKANEALFKPIIRFNKRGEMVMVYKSIKEASERGVFSAWTIGSIAKKEKKTTNTFLFKYKAA